MRATNTFKYEKLSVPMYVASPLRIWPSLHRQLWAYKETMGGTLYSALRQFARCGAVLTLQQVGIGVTDSCVEIRGDEFAVACQQRGISLEAGEQIARSIFVSLHNQFGADFDLLRLVPTETKILKAG